MTNGFTAADVSDQTGRTFLVTGANTGLGFEASKVLAERGARVLLGCRSDDKAQRAMAEITAEVPAADLDFVQLDQADLSSVRRAAEQVQNEDRLDVLVNNAGIMMPPKKMTVDGFESQFGVNHLGTFALTSLLLPKLAAHEGGRVVVTSSIAHRGAKIYFDDINVERSYRAQDRYGQSKLANLLFMYELDRRLRAAESATISVGCHPGIADTELARHLPGIVPVRGPAGPTVLQHCCGRRMADTHGGDRTGCQRRRLPRPDEAQRDRGAGGHGSIHLGRARDDALAASLWELSIEMTGIDPRI